MDVSSGIRRWAACALIVLAVAVASVPLAPEVATAATPLAGKVRPAKGKAFLGVFKQPAPFRMSPLEDYRKVAGRKPAIVMWYQPWSSVGMSKFDASACVRVWQQGAVPMITWEPWNPYKGEKQSVYQLRDINAGKYDKYIRAWARGAKAAGGPIMLRPMHEMNGTWYPWGGTVNGNTPAQFRSAWRRIHGIFKREGATNVTFVWSINHSSVPNTHKNRYAAYYPGSAYVDWTSISGYNWGTTRPGIKWRSFETVYSKSLKYLRTLKKPIVISEMASVSKGGNKAAWITDTYYRIRRYHPEVDAVVYYDKNDSGVNGQQDWGIASTKSSAAAYRKAVASKYYLSTPPAALTSWRRRLSTTQWSGLVARKRVY